MFLRPAPAYAIALICSQACWAQTTRPLPLGFEAAGSEFRARAQGYAVALDGTGASLRLANTRVLRFELEGSAKQAVGAGSGEEAGVASYLIGDDPSLWRRDVPQFSRVKYTGVYPGIDLIYYGKGRELEFDAVVAPGADPGNVRLRFEGSDRIRSNHAGGLLLEAAGQQVELQAPVVYQTVDGARRTIPASFVRHGNRRASLRIAAYDRALPLVIDPVVVTSTYIGGSGVDTASAITADTQGNYYVVGSTSSTDFPVTTGARTSPTLSGYAAFIIKFNSSGAPVYSTYISGNTGDGNSYAYGVAVDSAGDAYIAGNTTSLTFPATTGAYQSKIKGTSNGFALELNPAGSALTYSTLFGGTGQDTVAGLAVDVFGNAFIGGSTTSSDFPATMGAYQTKFGGVSDGFLVEVNPTGTGLGFATYLGAAGQDTITGIALDGTGSPYVTGSTGSATFPVTAGAFQTIFSAPSPKTTAFVAQFSFDGRALLYSTFLGGSGGDFAQAITLDLDGNVYVTGGTTSSDFPTTPGAFQTTYAGAQSIFASELDPALSTLVASTYVGGSGQGHDTGFAIAVAPNGSIYVGGQIGSDSLSGLGTPAARPAQRRRVASAFADDQPANSDYSMAVAFLQYFLSPDDFFHFLDPGFVSGLEVDNNSVGTSVYAAGNGSGAPNPTNAPPASPSVNANPPVVSVVTPNPDPITVVTTPPAGPVRQGDQFSIQTTITNISSGLVYLGIIGQTGFGSPGSFGGVPITSFVSSTAGQSGLTDCQPVGGNFGNQGYSCGVAGPPILGALFPDFASVQLQAGTSLMVTDTYVANFTGFPQRESTIKTIAFYSAVNEGFSSAFHTVGTATVLPILPVPVNCTENCPPTGTTEQQLIVQYLQNSATINAGSTFAATPTSGLPVTAVTADPKVCTVTPFPGTGTTYFALQTLAVPGTCIFTLNQGGSSVYGPVSITEAVAVTAAADPITVTKTLISPTGNIHQGDILTFQVTITNTSSKFWYVTLRDQVDGTGISEFLDSTAASLFRDCINIANNTPGFGANVGYDCGRMHARVIEAGQSIVITDYFHARFNGNGAGNFITAEQDTNQAFVQWGTQEEFGSSDYGDGLAGNAMAKVTFTVLPPPKTCSAPQLRPRGTSRKAVDAPADTGSCPVSGTTAQSINFPQTPVQAPGAAPIALNATASSGLPVTYAGGGDGTVCSVSGSMVTIAGPGSCFVTAEQPGNGTFAAAPAVTQVFPVVYGGAAGIQPVAGFLDQNGAPAITFNGSTSFPNPGGFLIGAPGITQAPNGNTYVVGLDGAGGVHLNSYSYDPGWNGWQYSGGILDTTSGLTAAVAPNGIVWFTGRDIGDRYWINSWNGTTFGGWILVADGIFAHDSIPQIAIPSDGTIYVVGTDIGGRIWTNSYDPTKQTFTGWVDRQGVIYGQPSVTAGQDGLVYVAVRNVASESPVYIMQIPAQNAATATTFLNGGGQIDTDPQITSQGGIVYLLAEADGNTVYLQTFSESSQTYGGWNFTNGILNDSTIAAAGGNVFIAGRDGADRIYWYSVTRNSWFFAGGAGLSSTVLTGGK